MSQRKPKKADDPELSTHAAAAADEIYRDLRGVKEHVNPVFQEAVAPAPAKPRGNRKGIVAPPLAYVASLGDYKTARQVSEILGCSYGMIYKLTRSDEVKAPSYVAPYGKTKVYLFTDDDVEEIRAHLKQRWGVTPTAIGD